MALKMIDKDFENVDSDLKLKAYMELSKDNNA